jgi:hypothetical protein
MEFEMSKWTTYNHYLVHFLNSDGQDLSSSGFEFMS